MTDIERRSADIDRWSASADDLYPAIVVGPIRASGRSIRVAGASGPSRRGRGCASRRRGPRGIAIDATGSVPPHAGPAIDHGIGTGNWAEDRRGMEVTIMVMAKQTLSSVAA